MVQFNLLPSVKLEYVKTQQTKRLLAMISVIVSAVSLVVLLLAFLTVDVAQKADLRHLDSDIAKQSNTLKSVKDLDKILTVQNQLGTLSSLHGQKPVVSRLFGFISQVTPNQVSLNKLSVDLTANTMTIGGVASSFDSISTYTDTLKATTYAVGSGNSTTHPFTSVVLSSFSPGSGGVSFTINCNFDPAIFAGTNDVKLTVPATTVTGQSSIFGGGK